VPSGTCVPPVVRGTAARGKKQAREGIRMPARSPTVEVSPAVLKWARESAGVALDQVARRLNTSVQTVEGWETGEKRPTLRTLEDLATFFKRPLAAFFLPEPPQEPPVPTDFRVLPEEQRVPLSRKTRLAVRRAHRLQRLAGDLLEEMDRAKETRIGRASLRGSPEGLAERERKRLAVSLQQQFSWRGGREAFRTWRLALESLGLLVFRFSMSLQETRGFSLTDTKPQAIVVNSQDGLNAQIFTLFHEYAHVLLHNGGLCLWHEALGADITPTEAFCNHFAGALLVPADALLGHEVLRRRRDAADISEDELRDMAATFCVSKHVVWRRMQVTCLGSMSAYRARLARWERMPIPRTPKRRGGPSPAQRSVSERGHRFSALVLDARDRGIITYRDVSDYLSVRLQHLEKVESLVAARSAR